MTIKQLNIDNFKLISSLELRFSDFLNILVGLNASGKTTTLDAIHYLELLRTTALLKGHELIKDLEEESIIKGVFFDKNTEKNKIVLISKYGYKMAVDGQEIKKTADYVADAAIVSFNNDDLFSLTGAPLLRRKMMNIIFCQCSRSYAETLKSYRNIIKEKSGLLKQFGQIDQRLFNVFSEQQFTLMLKIEEMRKAFCNKLNERIAYYHLLLTNGKENAELRLKYDFDITKSKEEFLKKCERDFIQKTCTCGCHRDDYQFIIDNHLITNRASQGQIKTITLAYKLACLDLLKSIKGINPIILLDDVFGELDKKRQNALLKILQSGGHQVFITTPSLSDIENEYIKDANIIHLEKGGTTNGY